MFFQDFFGHLSDSVPTLAGTTFSQLTDSTDFAEDDSGPGLYVSHWGTVNTGGFWGDMAVKGSCDPSWAKTDMGWAIVPWGFRKLLLWIQKRYR